MEEKKIHDSERELGRSIKKGMKAPHVKVVARILLAVLIITAIATFTTPF